MAAKTCAIVQPHYLPWMGYFEMIDRVDVFVFLDDVQFIKREWKNRNRIRKTPDSAAAKWLSVPIRGEDQRAPINQARIGGEHDWMSDHLRKIRDVYCRAPHFDAVFPALETKLEKAREAETLAALNIELVVGLCDILGIETPVMRSSEIGADGKREEKLLAICKAIGADAYLANNATAGYVGSEYFESEGIEFQVQDYSHPTYPQTSDGHALPFLSHLSIVDLLFNTGHEAPYFVLSGRPGNCR